MACSQDGGGAGKRACSCQEVCVYLLEGMGEREEHKSLMEGPSSGAHVAIGYAWAHGVMLFHTDPTPFAWGIEKRFRVVVWLLGEVLGWPPSQTGSWWSSLAERPYVEEVPVLRFDKDFSFLTTVVYMCICDCLCLKLPPGREGERKGISHECHERKRPLRSLESSRFCQVSTPRTRK